MRLIAQTKLGFYPASPLAVDAVLRHLLAPADGAHQAYILDPCCGEGLALRQLADGLGIPRANVYAVEFDAERAALARTNLGEDAHILGPASYDGTEIGVSSFDLAWVNPPFDVELGGGKREEMAFAQRATRQLRVGGILALVMPLSAIQHRKVFHNFLDSYYEDAALYQFQAEVRKFHEVVYIARKRKEPLSPDDFATPRFLKSLGLDMHPHRPVVGSDDRTWTIGSGKEPRRFKKVTLTEAEMWAAIEGSPLNGLLEVPQPLPPRRPPLPLHGGHIALLLASGLLNGLIETTDGYAFVVRGTARKVNYHAETTAPVENAKGEVTVKDIYQQKMVVEIRAVDTSGTMYTFGERAASVSLPDDDIGDLGGDEADAA